MISIVFIFVPLIAAAEADLVTLNNDAAYDEGVYGSYVSQHYVSTGVEAPRFNLWIEQESSEDESYNFLTPHGFKVTSTGPAIVDTTGALIWTSSDYGKALDFRVQQYAGQDCLTFWAGNGHVRGHGSGSYYIVSTSRAPVYETCQSTESPIKWCCTRCALIECMLNDVHSWTRRTDL